MDEEKLAEDLFYQVDNRDFNLVEKDDATKEAIVCIASYVQKLIKIEGLKARLDELNNLLCHCGEHPGIDADMEVRIRELQGELKKVEDQ
jgi:hypothetical protein